MIANCDSTGIGPKCSHPEKGDGEKYDCLTRERFLCVGRLNDCISQAYQDIPISYYDFTGKVWDKDYVNTLNEYHQAQQAYLQWMFGGDASKNVWTLSFSYGGVKDHAQKRVSAFVNCFRTIDCDWSKCYCPSITCEGPCLGSGGNGGNGGRIDSPDVISSDSNGPSGGPDNRPQPTNTTMVTGSQYGLPIPIVYASQLVAGNIIWMSDTRNNEVYTYADKTATPNNVATVDLCIGLCEGPIIGIGRIWYENTLIYDNRTGYGSVARGSAFGVDSVNVTNTDTTRTTFEVMNGEDDQLPIFDGVGYRGLAAVYIKNFNLSAVGRIPQFRVEVFTNASIDNTVRDYSVSSGPLYGLRHSFLYASPTADALILPSEFGMRSLVLSTLNETAAYEVAYTSVYQDVDMPTRVLTVNGLEAEYFDADKETRFGRTTLASEPTAGAVFNAYSPNNGKPIKYACFAQGADASFYTLPIDGGPLELGESYSGVFDVSIKGVAVVRKILNPQTGIPTYFDQLMYAGALGDGRIKLYSTLVRNTPQETFNMYAPAVHDYINPALWGGATSVELLGLQALPVDGTLLIGVAITNVGTCFIKYDAENKIVLWSSVIPHVAYMPQFATYDGSHFRVVTTGGAGYRIDLVDGTAIYEFDNEPITGRQFYDPQRGSITYIHDDVNGQVRSVYIGRLNADNMRLSDVVTDVLAHAGITSVDMTALDSTLIHGYAISTQSTARGVLEQIRQFYPVEFFEQRGAIVGNLRAGGSPTYLTNDNVGPDTGKESFEITETVKETQIQFMTVGFQRSDNGYALSHQTLRRPDFLGNDGTTQVQTHDGPFVMSDSEALLICERLLIEDDNEQRTASFVVGIKHTNLVPGDIASITINSIQFVGIVSNVVEEHGVRSRITLTRIDPTIYQDVPSVEATPDTQTVVMDEPIDTPPPFIPLILPVPLPGGNTYDNLTGYGNPVVTTIIPTNRDIGDGVDIHAKISGVPQKYGTITQYPHMGALNVLPNHISARFSVDRDSTLVISFNKPAPEFAAATFDELLANPKRNLLIVGGEYIQFMDYTMDPDGRTFTFTNLFRGMFGTDYFCNQHKLGEVCCVWEDAAIAIAPFVIYRTTSLVTEYGTSANDGIITWIAKPVTFYGMRHWATTSLYRYGSVGGTTFIARARSQLPYDLDDNNPESQAKVGLPGNAIATILLQPFDKDKFADAIEGKLTNYLLKESLGGTIQNNGAFFRYQPDTLNIPWIMGDVATTATNTFGYDTRECDVVVLFLNPTVPYGGTLQVAERDASFYIVFHFNENDFIGYPTYAGTV